MTVLGEAKSERQAYYIVIVSGWFVFVFVPLLSHTQTQTYAHRHIHTQTQTHTHAEREGERERERHTHTLSFVYGGISFTNLEATKLLWGGSKGVINFPWIFRQCGG